MQTQNHKGVLFSPTQPQFSTVQLECLFLCPFCPVLPLPPRFSSPRRPISDPNLLAKSGIVEPSTHTFPDPQHPKKLNAPPHIADSQHQH